MANYFIEFFSSVQGDYQADETTVLLAVNWYSLWNFKTLNAIF